MKKRLGRELRQATILVIGVMAIIFLILLLSQMGFVIKWLKENWIPFVSGFVVALLGKALTDSMFTENEKEENGRKK